MTSKQRNQTAAVYRPTAGTPGQPPIKMPMAGWSNPGQQVIDISPTRDRPGESAVSVATNQPTDWRVALLAGVFLILMFGFFGMGLRFWIGLPIQVVFLAVSAMGIYTGYRVLIIVNGDHVADKEVAKNEKVALASIESIDNEVEAKKEIILAAIAAQDNEQERQHKERVLTIETDQQLQLGYINDGRDQPVSDSYVANNTQAMKKAIRKYVFNCYTSDGFNREYINGPAGGLIRAPWNHEWGKEPWKKQAKAYMIKYVLDPVGGGENPSQFKLRYAKKTDAQDAMPRHQ